MQYPGVQGKDIIGLIQKEAILLEAATSTPIYVVSMHRPSKETLEANYEFSDMINSYSQTFFRKIKYLSDSRHYWREPVLDIIKSNKYKRLHILTHAFLYNNDEWSMNDSIKYFVNHANLERYYQMMENITDLPSIMTSYEVK